MEGKLEKAFTAISKVIVILLLGTSSCSDEVFIDEIPLAAFDDIFINLDLPQYNDLSLDGGFVLLTQGVRGIILYRKNITTYFAFEQNCTYLPNEAGATVNVDQSRLFMRDTSCGSTFSFEEGLPTSGPARVPLRRYRILQNGRTLTITDEPVQ